jgi:hypothetical protein
MVLDVVSALKRVAIIFRMKTGCPLSRSAALATHHTRAAAVKRKQIDIRMVWPGIRA